MKHFLLMMAALFLAACPSAHAGNFCSYDTDATPDLTDIIVTSDATCSEDTTKIQIGALADLVSSGILIGDLGGVAITSPTADQVLTWNGTAWVNADATGGVGVTDGDKGDMIVSGSGTIWNFDSGIITAFAKTFLNDTTQTAAQTTLGVLPGTDVQPYDADLAAEAAASSNGIKVRTGSGTVEQRTLLGTTNEIAVTNGSGVSGDPTIGLPSVVSFASKTLRMPSSTSLPGTCAVGDAYMDTDATSGARWYLCESTNTWAAQGGGGGGSGTVTSFTGTDGNGFDLTVTNSTTTPALVIETTVTTGSMIKSSSGDIVAATAGTDYVAPGTVTSYTAQQNFGTASLTDGTNIAWNLNTQQVATVTLGGNRTLSGPTNLVNGGTYILRIKQDATGSRTLAYNSAYRFPGGIDPVLSTTANAVDIMSCVSDGTNMDCVMQKDFQ